MYAPSRRFAVHLVQPWLRTLAGSAGGDDSENETAASPPRADPGSQSLQAGSASSAAEDSAADRKPPPDWYKRGVWIDSGIIETRMRDDAAPARAIEKEPETPVSRSLSAIIKVRARQRTKLHTNALPLQTSQIAHAKRVVAARLCVSASLACHRHWIMRVACFEILWCLDHC